MRFIGEFYRTGLGTSECARNECVFSNHFERMNRLDLVES
jgi:hypothetical protein